MTFWLSDGTLAARLRGLVYLSTACAGPLRPNSQGSQAGTKCVSRPEPVENKST